MSDALQSTINLLAHTRNQAAVPVLMSAVRSECSQVRLGAIRALVERRSPAGHVEILDRFPAFSEREQSALAEAIEHSSHHMRSALHDAVLAENLELCESACHVILLGRTYHLMPTLVTVAENRKHRHSDQAAATLVQLARLLQQEISGAVQRKTCDPFFMRREVFPTVERSVMRYGEHQRLEIIDAFLLLVPPANSTLFGILAGATHPCHRPVIESLSASAITSVIDLLAQLLHDSGVPAAALKIIAERRDRKFLEHLLHQVKTPASLRVLENMRRLTAVTWLGPARSVLLELDGPAQAMAVALAAASSIDRSELFSMLEFILAGGQPEGRRASCDVLVRFQDSRADALVVRALDDPDPRVQAAAVRQLRRRHAPDAMERLVTLLDHFAAEVRDAARSSLAEFNFIRYQSSFEEMDEKTRRTTGRLVRKVDLSAARRLADLLNSPSPSTRLRGLEMVIAMEATDGVFEYLVHLLEDTDLAVRTDAATALGFATHPDAQSLLRRAERDPSHCVREAATQSIERLRTGRKDDRVPPPATIEHSL